MRINPNRFYPTTSVIDRFFNDEFFNKPLRRVVKNGFVPAVNVKEDNDKFTVELAAPGLNKEDFKVEVKEDVLNISFENKTETTEGGEDKNFKYREFSRQSFKRAFRLPETVEAGNIEARYENGVLFLEIPKKEEVKPEPARLIEVA
ncbi:MAG: Hsp20/alpha crystallin family protein [Bacteroidota bacterium]